MDKSAIKQMIARIIANANDTLQEASENNNDIFYKGKLLAYYEVLDTIKNDLIIYDQDLKEFLLDINLEKVFF